MNGTQHTSLSERIEHAGLQIDPTLYQFINQEALAGLPVSIDDFWQRFAQIINELTPINRGLLAKRDQLQSLIDAYHQQNPSLNATHYRAFLTDIGYLAPAVAPFEITTANVEPEIASLAGPQLVVPVSNARFALNAANARWGSLYDALYGTDAISLDDGAENSGMYNPVRGKKVIRYGREFLDSALPLSTGSHGDSTNYSINNNQLLVTLEDSRQISLAEPDKLCGFVGQAQNPSILLFKNNGLHFEIHLDHSSAIGGSDPAGIKDIVLEAALTTIMDCEDSVAAVDAEDKVQVYRNWLGLMKGTLVEKLEKNGHTIERQLASDRVYTNLAGESFSLKGRSMMFVRNVGHLMTNPAILDASGDEVFEGIMDAMITSLAAMHDLNGLSKFKNSTAASINIVKPKMHGPDEVAFSHTLFGKVEEALGLPRFTLKMGIMDEERRTTVNLPQCIYQAKERVVFINTGFLDRTGDEIHTSMEAGVVEPKADIKAAKWIQAYENWNVDIGLRSGLSHKAQIGKGMWPIPDHMSAMMQQKIAHPQSGANTAWVPSPTAATLHAMHYHQVDVFRQQDILKERSLASLDDILTPPLCADVNSLTPEVIQAELDNNAQGILGYVVRWIDQGIGCSKVPDINNIGLMEDRATLRISSQHMANWLRHGVCSKEQVIETMKRMAKVVDQQNAQDQNYTNMAGTDQDFTNNIAFQAALELVLAGVSQPNGYTEPVLHRSRLKLKQKMKR